MCAETFASDVASLWPSWELCSTDMSCAGKRGFNHVSSINKIVKAYTKTFQGVAGMLRIVRRTGKEQSLMPNCKPMSDIFVTMTVHPRKKNPNATNT